LGLATADPIGAPVNRRARRSTVASPPRILL